MNKVTLQQVEYFLENHPKKKEFLAKCADGYVIDMEVREFARKIARHKRVPTLLYGETGTGKEEVAKLIHSNRCKEEGNIPFVAVNCANLTSTLAESLLFGHKKGAFTGATESTEGFIGAANGGILFLDEVQYLPPECQRNLLRVLNDGYYSRLGESKLIKANFQVIIATTKNIDSEVESGGFLADLRMRLLGIDIDLKPLREKKEEIILFVSLFFAKNGIKIPRKRIEDISKECAKYYWRGNIRQLIKKLEVLVAMADSEDDICAENLEINERIAPSPMSSPIPGISNDIIKELIEGIQTDGSLEERVNKFEKFVIKAALKRHDNLSKVTNALSISRTALHQKRKKYNLLRDEE